MIVDIHTHLAEHGEISPTLAEDMLRCGISPEKWNISEGNYVMDTSAADITVVFGLRARATGWSISNERVAAFAAGKERCIFFASIDPAEEDYMEQLRYSHTGLKCRGIKLGPVYQGVHPHDPRYYDIYKYCQEYGLPILTHMATTFASGVPLEYARPILMDRVACDFPGLRIILAHMGHPWEGEAIAAIRKQKNLYADISALYYRPLQFYNTMRLLEEYGAWGKVFFGSDYPACTTRESIDGLMGVNDVVAKSGLPLISQTVIEEILYKNPLEILGI